MSLRARLSLIASLLFLAGMIAGVSFLVSSARQRVADEVESTATLTYQLLDALVLETAGVRDNSALLARLLGVEKARHMAVSIENAGAVSGALPAAPDSIDAPGWFVRRVMPEPLEYRIPLAGGDVIVIRTNPADEISEVWRETRYFMAALLMVLLVLNGILYFTVGRWFRPVGTIVRGLEEVEKGNFSGYIADTSLPELKIIVEKLNHLTDVLRASKAENDRLTARSLSIQEQERRHLARELHDELGQSISAINAIAFSIAERIGDTDASSADGAQKIGAISTDVHNRIRGMMRRLRPSVLDELGLGPALEQMVDEWNGHHKDTFCSLRLGKTLERLDDTMNINLYRIIQESLTNVARHADAETVEVSLEVDGEIRLQIRDDGRGFDPDSTPPGMGLTGMRERAHALNGGIDILTRPGEGVTIKVNFPGPGK